MNAESNPPNRVPNSWATVILATMLTVGGLAGAGISLYQLGLDPTAWQANVREALPLLAHASLGLACGLALGFTHRSAVVLLALLLVSRGVWEYVAQWGWVEPGHSSIEVLALLYALYLHYNGRLGAAGPNNSSKPTPLRGAA